MNIAGLRFLPLALLAAVATGCVTVRNAPPSFGGDWPPFASGPRPSIALAISVRATDSGWPRDPGPILGPWGMATERAYRESALFAGVSTQSGRADLRVEVELRADVSRYDVFTALAWLTLFVLPTVDTTNIAVVTRVVTPNGSQSISTIEVSGRSQTWYQILLFPFSPLFPPQAVTPQIVYDLNRQTIDELHARGVF
jgi:hypothetical protein